MINNDQVFYASLERLKMSSRKCKYNVDASHVLCEVYEEYFDCPIQNQDKSRARHVACSYCRRCLEGKQFLIKRESNIIDILTFISIFFVDIEVRRGP